MTEADVVNASFLKTEGDATAHLLARPTAKGQRRRAPAGMVALVCDRPRLRRVCRHAHRRYGLLILLAGTDAVDLFHRQHEDLAVADRAGSRGLEDGVDRRLDEMIRHADLQPHLFRQTHLHGRAAVRFHVLAFAAVALDAADADALDVGSVQLFENRVDAIGTDD